MDLPLLMVLGIALLIVVMTIIEVVNTLWPYKTPGDFDKTNPSAGRNFINLYDKPCEIMAARTYPDPWEFDLLLRSGRSALPIEHLAPPRSYQIGIENVVQLLAPTGPKTFSLVAPGVLDSEEGKQKYRWNWMVVVNRLMTAEADNERLQQRVRDLELEFTDEVEKFKRREQERQPRQGSGGISKETKKAG